ncbi:MAG: Radical SAM domain protein [Magnetococcales bacterium]|nr:Radical SAM domain protein [Magnetococcales bacterium]HIJ83919.1 radical SAM protein [Magnetococcales bacterium]
MGILYSTIKFLRFQDHIEAIRNKTVIAPVHVRIKPINRCNHHCWYCAYKVDHLQLGADMVEADAIPEDKMIEIADDLITMGVKAVTFSGGGEPLLYKPLPKIMERLANGGVRVAALTNGANLKGRLAQAFAQHATWVRLSLDAWDDASFAKIRNVKHGEFSRTLVNMRNFSDLGSKCVIGVSFVITKENHEHIEEACALFKDAGVNHCKLSGVVVSNSGGENNDYHRPIMESASTQIKRAKNLADAHFSIIDHYHELEERFDKSYTFCPYLLFLPVIGADLGVYTCHDKAYNQKGLLGYLQGRTFKEFWLSEENKIKIKTFDPSVQCRHHCVAHSRNLAILEYLAIDPDHAVFV